MKQQKTVYHTTTEVINSHPCYCRGVKCECTCIGPMTVLSQSCTDGWTYQTITCVCGHQEGDCYPTGMVHKEGGNSN